MPLLCSLTSASNPRSRPDLLPGLSHCGRRPRRADLRRQFRKRRSLELECAGAGDADGDRLEDCWETATGIFVDEFDTGTDPDDADTDDDGLADGDEVLGTLAGLDLPGLGVSPLRKDLLLEYDWFDDAVDNGSCAAHSHRPTAAAVAKVTAAFAAAPVANPDGSTGIHFVHDYGQGGLLTGGNLVPDADGVLNAGVGGADFVAIKAAHFATQRKKYFHYVVLPHRYNVDSSSSGQAERPGDDMIVSLYCSHSDKNVAHTIVHELGHNLNLRHGGFENCNYKPNYNSVMNYRYQFPGVDSNCTPPGDSVLDYSHDQRIDLDEDDLDEREGICEGVDWDWNGNALIEPSVLYDVNASDPEQVAGCGGTRTVLRDSDDWQTINLTSFTGSSGFAPPPETEIIDCDNRPPTAAD